MSWLAPALVTIIFIVIKAIMVLLAVIICGALFSWVECRLLGLWRGRYGPNRVGPFGAFQLGADTVKMSFKEGWTSPFVDKMTFTLAPVIAMGALFVAFAIVPTTPTWGVADLSIGILFFLVMAGLTAYAVLLAGWLSNNKFALLDSLHTSTQTISYEVFPALPLMGIIAQVDSFNMYDIAQYQIDDVWFIIPQFFGFCAFIITGVVVTHRHSFDQPEAEQELTDGYHTEYAGMKWGMFFAGEYIGTVLVSALLVTLFFSGWHSPFLDILLRLSLFYFVAKTGFFIMLFIPIRASLPRPRYDQVIALSRKVRLPLTLINLLVTGALVLAVAQ